MSLDDDEHPLLLELTSLRQTAARFQHEAHAAAIKLQRHSLDSSCLHEYAATLEQENARLTHELGILRAHPDVPPHPAEVQIQELSLALRRVSDKITLTENTLLKRTSEVIDTRSELLRAKHTADGAYELAARTRAREEACKARERELELKARASEEELKMVNLVIQEYADLVRNLEGRKSASHTSFVSNGSTPATTLVDKLQDGRSTLHEILTAFSTESEQLHATIAELNAKVSTLQMTLDAERMTASHDRTLLSQAKTELDKLDLEDQTAAKMVARYMKFSQASTNALQQQITALRVRHTSTIATFELQLSIAESQFASERARVARLQDALDELCEDLARESYGRRREVALRLALLSKEEGIAESMRRWARKARELYTRCYNTVQPSAPHDSFDNTIQEAFCRVVSDAESLLSSLDDGVQVSDETRTSGPLARIILSMEAVDSLRRELQNEVQKRVEAVRKSTFSAASGHLDETESRINDLSEPESAPLPSSDEPSGHLLLTPSGDARSKHEAPLVSLSPSEDVNSPLSTVAAPGEPIDDPFIVFVPVAPPITEIMERTVAQGEMHSLYSPTKRDSLSTSVTLLVDEEPEGIQPYSPTVLVLDLQQDSQFSRMEESSTIDVEPIHGLPKDISILHPLEGSQVLSENDDTHKHIPSTLISTPMPTVQSIQVLTLDNTSKPSTSMPTATPVASDVGLDPSTPSTPIPALLSELAATRHRYDTLQRAFRDCSLALKELKHTLAHFSPPSHAHPKFCQHLEMALARIDDYAEDARVELEIRIADEELTARGFETVLSIPGALVSVDERVEVEASAREFVSGTDGGVSRALEKFEKKLEDVQHDVAAVKRAVHGLAMSEEDRERRDEGLDGGNNAGVGTGWTAWTAGLLGAKPTPSRSPTPMQTFGTVMTSPRPRHAASLKHLHAQASVHGGIDWELLAGLNLRIPIPSSSLPHPPFIPLGLGRAREGPTRPRTLSAMYAVGGLRSSSIGLGVGLGGSPRDGGTRNDNSGHTEGTNDGELRELGDVE